MVIVPAFFLHRVTSNAMQLRPVAELVLLDLNRAGAPTAGSSTTLNLRGDGPAAELFASPFDGGATQHLIGRSGSGALGVKVRSVVASLGFHGVKRRPASSSSRPRACIPLTCRNRLPHFPSGVVGLRTPPRPFPIAKVFVAVALIERGRGREDDARLSVMKMEKISSHAKG
ncbi:hypothetical protein SEVIR_9G491200v4 [Setaria viridis]|uniref:Uncharacterized protein n=1 Tax=Setaria viridis TaxID=4556 RepID=A0A4U6T9A1_SETVI|nr:hypothetical protein SEVIR_9G491200v2 [Setaria viridis]TKV97392.1 hypothetical protein SEVIR_9G491200v2 [Setaria viridis]TKV97393.1 hypothetical protein SEVIR_9G491200v2 [Setaria viridis]TKV97394.1 hypothetical protein SEVIR_9G491200v2 [Setaria viridis]TKV97395.1 hypothetical protein SEVIR_9G491200v2 [Setaria viridis]